jgi:nucleotide-binding universal stress UspA family protein
MSQRPRFTRVTVAVDFGPQATVAASRAAWLPLGPTATISLVHPVPDSVPEAARVTVADEVSRSLEQVAEKVRAEVRSRGHLDVTVEAGLAPGRPFVEIIRHARARGAELIVMGRRDPRERHAAVDEQTAERVIRKSDTPTLLAHGHAEGPYRRALLAVDLSDASRRVGELALALVPPDVDALRVVHAFHVPFAEWFGAETLEAYRRDARESVRAGLGRVRAMLEPFGVECVDVVREGEPRTVLLREVMNARADLVVLGTHARSGVAHALLGSVAEWIVRAAPCDVAVTRPARYTFELP